MEGRDVTPLDDATRLRMERQSRAGTYPEMALRRELHRRGLRYRVDVMPKVPGMRGRVDVLFGPTKVAVYVDGCFWHGCPEHSTAPKNNAQWWADKIDANRQRDRRATELLAAAGFLVIRIWEHEDLAPAADLVESAVLDRRTSPVDKPGAV